MHNLLISTDICFSPKHVGSTHTGYRNLPGLKEGTAAPEVFKDIATEVLTQLTAVGQLTHRLEELLQATRTPSCILYHLSRAYQDDSGRPDIRLLVIR